MKFNINVITLTTSLLLPTIMGTTVYAADMEGLGDLVGSSFSSSASAISGDGSTVVGRGRGANGTEAFRWTSADGMVGLGDLDGSIYFSNSSGVSQDGSTVVGYSYGANGAEAFRWTAESGMEGIGDLPGSSFFSTASAVSGDGLVIVGQSMSNNSANYAEAFRWTSAGGMVGLGDLDGGVFSSNAKGVNSDGSVVVGRSRGTNGSEAFRWTAAGGMVGLGALDGGSFWSDANAVNSDGSVVVGVSSSAAGGEAFRWIDGTGMVGLGILPGYSLSTAYAVNSSGEVIVGSNENDDTEISEAFRWTEGAGMLSLADWLEQSGHTLTGWTDTYATGVSDDGKIVVGSGQSANGYQAYIARGKDGLIGVKDFSSSLQSAGSVIAQGVNTTQTILHGAHGHPGANRALDDKRFMWLAGDLAKDEQHDSDDDFSLAEVGTGYRYSDTLSMSAALGKTWSNSNLLYGGSSNNNGIYLALDADIRLPVELPLYATLTYLQGNSDLSIRRGYLNAGNLDASTGNTNQTTQGLRARLQLQSARQHNQFELHPYVEYNMVKVKTDGYTETGGGFPTTYNSTTETVNDWRLGTDINRDITAQTRFLGTLEAVHRMEKSGNGVSGQVIGLSTFELAGRDYDQNWLRVTAGIEHNLGDGRLTLTINSSSKGEDPAYWGGVNYTKSF